MKVEENVQRGRFSTILVLAFFRIWILLSDWSFSDLDWFRIFQDSDWLVFSGFGLIGFFRIRIDWFFQDSD